MILGKKRFSTLEEKRTEEKRFFPQGGAEGVV